MGSGMGSAIDTTTLASAPIYAFAGRGAGSFTQYRTASLWSVPALGLVWSKYIVAFVHKHYYKLLYETCDIRGQALMHVKSRLVSVSLPYRS